MSRRPPAPLTPERLRGAALRYLERHPTSSAHLRRVLLRRVDRHIQHHGGEREPLLEQVESVITRMAELGYVDDQRYARDRARSLHRSGASARKIRARLREKGVPQELVDAGIAELAEATDAVDPELEAAARYARRRGLGPYRRPGRERGRDKELASLGRAGFGYGVAARIVDCPDEDALEAMLRGHD